VPTSSIDLPAVVAACERQAGRPTPGTADMAAYLERQVSDLEHREVVGPLLDGSGASGTVLHRGETVASWGDPSVPEMAFSATKSIVALVAGVAYDRGLLRPERRVVDTVDLDELRGAEAITWQHLLQQTSSWDGVLWGKPTAVDAQSTREGDEVDGVAPGAGWAYNDVRINLLTLALTALLQQSLEDVLREQVLEPLGAGGRTSWHGYATSVLELDGRSVPVVSGGAHWGGGLFVPAEDLARIGQLHLDRGRAGGRQLVSEDWLDRVWTPCPVKPEYGFLWWLNDTGKLWPGAPRTGRCARGNGGRHLLWVDPARDLVVVSRWGEDVGALLVELSAAVPAR
jgi:CubicO group peptidase (beta-lactamase class C family)